MKALKIFSVSVFAAMLLLVVVLEIHYEITKGPDPYLVHRLDPGRFSFRSGWSYRVGTHYKNYSVDSYDYVVKSDQMAYGDTTWHKIMLSDGSPNVGISLTPENGLVVIRFDSLPPYHPLTVYPMARYHGDSTWYIFNYPGEFKEGIATFGHDHMPIGESRPEISGPYDYAWEYAIKVLDSRVLPDRDGWKIIPARPR
ncbi:hypothetical protein GYA54_02020 [Candidatus Kuenenbacteria bacterium]|nr:hypothetical protein [Candidatus Kuenenbacteria bacterium]